MNKNYLILLAVFLIVPFALSNSIADFKIPAVIPLNEDLTFYGNYIDANGAENVLCSFYIFDLNDQGQLIMRLSDEYTTVSGAITSTPYKITEPLFKRGFDYNAIMYCNTSYAFQTFYIEQKNDYAFGINPNSLSLDFAYFLNPNNAYVLVFFFVMLIVVGGIAYLAYTTLIKR